MASNYTDILHEPSYYPLQAEAFLTFATKARESSKTVKVNKDYIVAFENELSFFEANIRKLILSYNDLSAQINKIFDVFFSIGKTNADTFNFFVNIGQFVIEYDNFSTGDRRDVVNVAKDEFLTNLKFIQQAIAIYTLSRMLPIAASVEYQLANEVTINIGHLKNQYNFVKNNNIFKNTQNKSVVLVDNINPLVIQYSESMEALKNYKASLPLVQDLEITRESLIPIVYRLYGDLDKLEEVATLNRFQSPFDLQNSIRVITDV